MNVPPPSPRWRNLVAPVLHDTIDLAPLDLQQVRQLLPPSVTAARVSQIAEQARGNPFWAKEIAASMESADTPIPPLARTLTARLAQSLTSAAADALAVVGAAGRISVARAQAVLSYLANPAAVVDEVVLAGVVTEANGKLTAAHL